MNRKIYISGPVSNDKNHKKKFLKKQKELEREGYQVINPVVKVKEVNGKTWLRYLIECLELIEKEQPEEAYMLMDWESSDGARIERLVMLHNEKLVIEE